MVGSNGKLVRWILMNMAQCDDDVAVLLQEGVVDLLATFVSWSLPEPQGCHGCYLRLPVRHGRQDFQSPSCSIQTERTTGLTDYTASMRIKEDTTQIILPTLTQMKLPTKSK